MRHGRKKTVKRILNFFRRKFGFIPPFRVIVDGTFLGAIEHEVPQRVSPKDLVSRSLLGEQVVLMTTNEVVDELEKMGEDFSSCKFLAKRMQRVRVHRKDASPLTSVDSIIAAIGEVNEEKYFVATQVSSLRDRLSKIKSGVPVLYIARGGIPVLRDPSDVQRIEGDKRESERMTRMPSELVKRIRQEEEEMNDSRKRRKKKNTRGPNPLSCLPSKKKKKNKQ